MRKLGMVAAAGLIVVALAVVCVHRSDAVSSNEWFNDYRPGIVCDSPYLAVVVNGGNSESVKANPVQTAQNTTTVENTKNTTSETTKPKTAAETNKNTVKKPLTVAAATTRTPTPSRGSASSAGGIIPTARNYIGVHYVYGGTSPNGFDCSGFTQYVFNKNGVSLPRTAAQQASSGRKVARSELAPGDLVFFNTDSSGGISHVGIYTGGNQFIHASRTKGITVTSLDDSYYKGRFITASRVVR